MTEQRRLMLQRTLKRLLRANNGIELAECVILVLNRYCEGKTHGRPLGYKRHGRYTRHIKGV